MSKRIIAGLLLSGFAAAASAQIGTYRENVIASDADSCPAGTAASVPSYEWDDGRFVRNGWLCESRYKGGH